MANIDHLGIYSFCFAVVVVHGGGGVVVVAYINVFLLL